MDAIRAYTALANMRAHIVISATTRADEISGIVSAFAGNGPRRALITKRDEVMAPGALLAQALRIELPISYVSNGPNVPEDLACPGADELAGQMLPALPLETVEAAS